MNVSTFPVVEGVEKLVNNIHENIVQHGQEELRIRDDGLVDSLMKMEESFVSYFSHTDTDLPSLFSKCLKEKWLRFSILPLLKTVKFQIVAGMNRYRKTDCLRLFN
ncbi:unnamed protein product [Trifolium pratense]|uniref:Uncharacterized protein n=1 Tax=Trifolium pratense TaxID=57577 RepID=A0ACB0J1I0_TRIPR|nr:unnamed protein product [Trifolium pratense]